MTNGLANALLRRHETHEAAIAIVARNRHHARRRQYGIAMKQRSLDEWLDYQLHVHTLGVDLGLARVREVWQRMGAPPIAANVITVGGTNGKGSTVAFLEAMLIAADRRVGCFTSPHLLRYNERVRVCGADIDDASLIYAFERIEIARLAPDQIALTLTYFEFGTLAALWIFAHSELDFAVLEVGLGGRLDAVNIIDADAAIVTTVDLDHEDWLGNDIDTIAREKAGIFRARRPAIIGDIHAPAALLEAAQTLDAQTFVAGRDYQILDKPTGWQWRADDVAVDLPEPGLAASAQRANAAAAIAALYTLRDRICIGDEALATGVSAARITARLQRFGLAGAAEFIVDVAHNPQAARMLAQWLAEHPHAGRNLAVFGALSDKDIAGIVAPLAAHIDAWFIGGLDTQTPRGIAAGDLADRVVAVAGKDKVTDSRPTIAEAIVLAAAVAHADDRILAFGSFFVAAAGLQWAAVHRDQ
jgi:dihydrofolate synthase / folylpolyglutamate synthase